MILRLTAAVILGALLRSLPAVAQETEPSQEVAPPMTFRPSYDPFPTPPANTPPAPVKTAPRLNSVLEPKSALVAPPPAAPLPTPFDGIWFGAFSCAAFHAKPSLTYRLIMEIKNGSWSRLNALTSTPGQPGYDHYEGVIDPDGHVLLTRTGVGDGLTVDGAKLGEATSSKFVGMFQGPRFIAWGVSGRCRIQLAKQL